MLTAAVTHHLQSQRWKNMVFVVSFSRFEVIAKKEVIVEVLAEEEASRDVAKIRKTSHLKTSAHA